MDVVVIPTDELVRLLREAVRSEVAEPPGMFSRESRTTKEWLPNREAMEFTGLSKATLQRLRKSGALPFSKVGNSVFYKYDDLVNLLERNRQEVSR